VTRFNQNGEQYDVIVQVAPDDRRTPGDLDDIYVRGRDGAMIQLSNLVRVARPWRRRSSTASTSSARRRSPANIAPGYSLGEALDFLSRRGRARAAGGARYDYSGESREFKEAGSSLCSSSCWRWASSSWCWPRSSRASSIP
jgi:multidrug efflux pump